jgi:hypothetical protein
MVQDRLVCDWLAGRHLKQNGVCASRPACGRWWLLGVARRVVITESARRPVSTLRATCTAGTAEVSRQTNTPLLAAMDALVAQQWRSPPRLACTGPSIPAVLAAMLATTNNQQVSHST